MCFFMFCIYNLSSMIYCHVIDMMFWCLFSQQLPEYTSWRAIRVRLHGRLSHQWEGILWAMCSRCWWDASQNTNRFVSHTHTHMHAGHMRTVLTALVSLQSRAPLELSEWTLGGYFLISLRSRVIHFALIGYYKHTHSHTHAHTVSFPDLGLEPE